MHKQPHLDVLHERELLRTLDTLTPIADAYMPDVSAELCDAAMNMSIAYDGLEAIWLRPPYVPAQDILI